MDENNNPPTSNKIHDSNGKSNTANRPVYRSRVVYAQNDPQTQNQKENSPTTNPQSKAADTKEPIKEDVKPAFSMPPENIQAGMAARKTSESNLPPQNQQPPLNAGNPHFPANVKPEQQPDNPVSAQQPNTNQGIVAPSAGAQKVAKQGFFSKINKKVFLIVGSIFIVLIVLLVIVSLLTGGGSGGGLLGTKGEIVWWSYKEDERTVLPLIKEYEDSNPGVTIRFEKQSEEDYRERLTNSLSAGKGPDIFEIHNSWVPMFANYVSVAPEDIMSQAEFQQKFYPVIVKDLSVQKGVVAIPLYYDALTLYINQDIFASAAKFPPNTWNDLRPLAFELTQKDSSGKIIQSGISMGHTENIDHWEEIVGFMLYQNNVDLQNPSDKATQDALSFYKQFSNNWDTNFPPSTISFAEGKSAMYFGPVSRSSEIKRYNQGLSFRTVPLPQLPKSTPSDKDTSYATYWANAVWSKSVNKEEAWKFLDFLTSRESLIKLNQNLEQSGLVQRAYPRMDMENLLIDHPIVGSVVKLASDSKSWYLAGNTNDGENGINTKMSLLFEEALAGGRLENLAEGVQKVLSEYGIRVLK